jgi:hypothetical protein
LCHRRILRLETILFGIWPCALWLSISIQMEKTKMQIKKQLILGFVVSKGEAPFYIFPIDVDPQDGKVESLLGDGIFVPAPFPTYAIYGTLSNGQEVHLGNDIPGNPPPGGKAIDWNELASMAEQKRQNDRTKEHEENSRQAKA